MNGRRAGAVAGVVESTGMGLGRLTQIRKTSRIHGAAAGKGRAMRTVRFLFCVLALAVVSAQARPQEASPSGKITVTGTLTRVSAIGGETSACSLEFNHERQRNRKKVRPHSG